MAKISKTNRYIKYYSHFLYKISQKLILFHYQRIFTIFAGNLTDHYGKKNTSEIRAVADGTASHGRSQDSAL